MYEVGKSRKGYQTGNTVKKQKRAFILCSSYLSQLQTPVTLCQIHEVDALFPWPFLCLISLCRVQDGHQRGMGLSHQSLQLAQGINRALSYDPVGVGACLMFVLLNSCALYLSKACTFPQRTTEHFYFGMRNSRVLIIQHLVNIEACF